MSKPLRTLAHFCRVLVNRDGPESQVTDVELSLLLKYSHDAPCIVEIGCFEGKTAAALARNTTGHVFSIDPFFKGRAGISYGRCIARVHFVRQRVRNVQLIQGLSFKVAPRFSRPIDFLFIDADHSYQGIERDWADWFPKVRIGGFVALHDCKRAPNSPDILGSMQFYSSDLASMSGIEEIAAADSLVIFRRNQ